MAMFKIAQYADDDLVISLPIHVEHNEPEEVVMLPNDPHEEHVVEMQAPEHQEAVIVFELPELAGDTRDPDVVELTDEVEMQGDDADDEKDKSKVVDQPKDLNWVKSQFDKIPKHRGESLGLERAKSFLSRLLGHLSKMLQEDHECKIDVSKAEDARIVIEDGIERLDKELQKRKKKANVEGGVEKNASTRVGGVIVTVPILISSIARTCINSTVSGGKDIENTFERLAKKFKLTDREKVEVIQLLADMNFPMRRDMGFMIDDDEKYEYSGENNYNYVPNYHA